MKIFKNAAFFVFLLAFSSVLAFAQETGGAKGNVRTIKGDGISGATVTARLKGQDIKSAKSDAKGNFEMTGLLPGIYNFVFEKSGYGAGIKYNVEIKKKKTEDLGDRLILMVDQGTLVLINGSVYKQDGRSITGARIEIEKINSDGSTKKLGSGYTNVSGEFTFRQPEGTAKYRITASIKGVSDSKEISVEGAGVYRLAITLNLPKDEEK
ncbi:MAG: carboxypeptidase-like regulatory domain-containing protein [Actinomycetota bacterium]